MITKVTKANQGLYTALFEKATADLAADNESGTPIVISSLDDFFLNITALMGSEEGENYYGILPLDEPFFEIDANTRVIKVPSEFKANGISVKGDQISEIVFFTIDRYYDSIDLYDDEVKIFIQCEDAGHVQHVYPNQYKNVSILKSQGKMIFGWGLDQNVTSTPGAIKFSVRFVKADAENNTSFSLSTLNAEAIINPALDFAFKGDAPEFLEVIDNSRMIRSRIKDSEPDGTENLDSIAIPMFFVNIPKVTPFFQEEVEDYQGNIINLNYVDLIGETDESKKHQLSVIAICEQEGEKGLITYDWYRADITDDVLRSKETVIGFEDFVLASEINETVFSGSHPYYTKRVVNGVDSYEVYETRDLVGEPIDGEYYVKVNSFNAQEVGDYWVVAKNRVGNLSQKTTSAYVRIPGPETLTVTTDSNLQMDSNGNYKVILDSEGDFRLEVVGKTARYGHEGGDKEFLSYVWSEVPSNGDPISKKSQDGVLNGTASFYEGSVAEEDANLYDKIFQVETQAFRNKACTPEQPDVKKFRVTKAPQVPKITIRDREKTINSGETAILGINVDVHDIVSDEITYAWYKMGGRDTDQGNDTFWADTAEIEVSESGSFYCIVTNTVNELPAHTRIPDPNDSTDRDLYTTVTLL